jgi:hypothetical protein
MGITIGQSTLADVEQLLSSLSDAYVFIDDDDYDTRFVIFDLSQREPDIPSAVLLCLLNNEVQVLATAYNYDLSVPRPNLSDLVAQLGEPDAITWTENPASRVAFWFEQGIAVEVTVIPNNPDNPRFEPTFGRIVTEFYFPYQEVEGYEDRWPYNQTRKFNPFLSYPYEGMNDYGPENPFDFDSMIATLTAEPSRTPTPTFGPPPPTATPTLIPPTNTRSLFPNLDCQDIEAPYEGPTWNGITIGSSTIGDLRDVIRELSPNYREYIDPSLGVSQFLLRGAVAKAEGVPAQIYACVRPEDEIITGMYVPTPFEFYNIHIRDLVAKYGAPDLVLWDAILSARVLVWLTEGVAASVSVDESEQFVPYGSVIVMLYFPYQSLEGYEERWPYTHQASSRDYLVTLTPSLPHETNPFDFDSMIATLTAEPSPTPTPNP